jgi:hypothetical protein
VDSIHNFRSKAYRGPCFCRVKSGVTAAESENFLYPIGVMEFKKDGPDHIIQTRAKAAAGHYSRTGVFGIEKKHRPGAGHFKRKTGRSRLVRINLDYFRYTDFIAYRALYRRFKPGFPKDCNVHAFFRYENAIYI